MKLKVNLKVERAKRDWTQSDLAEKSGICRLSISNLETGKQDIQNLTIKQILKLAEAFDIPFSDFFSQED
ncbi:helix-turn-helix transcriptional regulator [Clostridium cadaveris]|uniref:helix-turn-helix transcriptional regulator n=1 Tax=Clostridium cadaveris TaxID=1529 RepID=UPI0039A1DC42